MKSENGQSMVEFAIIIPIFILLLFAILDFGRVFHAYLSIDHAGREAARAAIIGDPNAKTDAINNVSGIDKTKIVMTITPEGDDVKVITTYPVDFLTPIISKSVFNLKNTTVMRLEQ